jgi:hypothetical protein
MSQVIDLQSERLVRQLDETMTWLLIRQAALTGLLRMLDDAGRGISPFEAELLEAALHVAEHWRPIAGEIPQKRRAGP